MAASVRVMCAPQMMAQQFNRQPVPIVPHKQAVLYALAGQHISKSTSKSDVQRC
jgi:hypothetical protein